MKADKSTILRLLKTARGQLDGILRMVEEDRYCVDISNQLMAMNAIVKKVNAEVLHAHLSNCVQDALASNDAQGSQEKLEELDKILYKLLQG